MRSLFHSSANQVAAILMKLLFGCVARVHVVRRENANRDGGFRGIRKASDDRHRGARGIKSRSVSGEASI
jgi:hypothetical protein